MGLLHIALYPLATIPLSMSTQFARGKPTATDDLAGKFSPYQKMTGVVCIEFLCFGALQEITIGAWENAIESP